MNDTEIVVVGLVIIGCMMLITSLMMVLTYV
jgi:hypothetical protein